MKKLLVLLGLFGLALNTNASIDISDCLTKAYPKSIDSVKNGVIYFTDGKTMPVGKVSNAGFTARLKNASVADQLSQTYPLHFNPPKQYEDAGRLRSNDFFTILYGKNLAQVNKNIVRINWKPSNSTLRFNRLNNAALNLEKVGDEIAQDPTLTDYVSKSLGSLNFRKISGTNRLSSHSFGVAVDFHLPEDKHRYWRWSGCTNEDTVCPYPKSLLNDSKLNRVVSIFEKHGFIWGGKWASYDSMHFEYRPELLIQECR